MTPLATCMPNDSYLLACVKSGAVELYEQDMIEGVLDLQRSQVQQIMTPRVELVAIKAESSLVELLELAREYKYSRVPVYNQSVDEINGVVLSRELLEFTDSAGELMRHLVATHLFCSRRCKAQQICLIWISSCFCRLGTFESELHHGRS